jgi:hypothetical protein
MSITITVETGAVVTGANSFVSLADFKTYHGNRGNALTSYADEVQKAALVKAGDYLNGLSWRGRKTAQANPMCWPRCDDQIYAVAGFENITTSVGVVDADGFIISTSTVPAQVVSAQCEAAYLILGGETLQPTLSRGGQLKRKEIDVIKYEWFPGAPPTSRYLGVEALLKGLLRSGMSIETVRS